MELAASISLPQSLVAQTKTGEVLEEGQRRISEHNACLASKIPIIPSKN